jgi:DNA-directed RNA polymerase subunit omega
MNKNNNLQNMEKYQTIVKISKRARQLVDGAEPMLKIKSQNPVMIAMQELEEGKYREAKKTDSL